ncbi:sensor histidine kinase [Pedobacter sp.]|uniref:sensor histidine kinase n=1 Tax=Pedobacter sp. TaxID=1411316 RepID=UPI00396C3061
MTDNSKASIVLNCIYWGIISLIIAVLIFSSPKDHSVKDYLISIGIYGLLNISMFYINYIYLMPELIIKRKRYWVYFICFVVLLGIVTLIKAVVAVLNPEEILQYTRQGKTETLSITTYVINCIFSGGFFLVSSCIIKFATDWFSNMRIRRNLETEKKDMELQFLKSQLNPHFLFNSLNNIYSLAYQKSDKTADAILKLSEIMRYMIYESNDSWVSLNKEVEYVQSFVDLQRLRFKDGAAVEVTIHGEIDGQKIVPLILISFVENAFKHGVANDHTDPIRINIVANQKILHFSVTNKKSKANKDAIGGVGLNNVERRLQLLYPDRYKLNIVNTATHYTTELMLDL